MRHLLSPCCLVLAALAASPALAQSRGYVLGTAGHGSLWDDEGRLGNGAVFGGAFGWNLGDHLSIEAAVSDARHERRGTISWTGRPRSFTARAVYRFGDAGARARLFVAGGGGYFRYPGTFTETVYDAPATPPRLESRDWLVTGRALELGTGLEINAGPLLFVRPEGWFSFGGGSRTQPAPEPFYTMPRVAVSAGVRF